MTICDAAKYLEGLFADKNVGDDIEGIVQEEIEAAQVAVWLLHDRMRRDALQPLDENGLARCGCGGKAILFHQPDIEGPGSDGDRWAVFCEKTCGMETSDMTSREYAVETWNTGMGYTAPPLPGAIGPETDGTAPIGDKGAEL